MRKTSVKIEKHGKALKNANYSLDNVSGKRRRGRPFKIKASWVRGRADNYRAILGKIWDRVRPRLLKAKTHEELALSFQGTNLGDYTLQFIQLSDLIRRVVADAQFPKQNRKAQINFLADSIAGHGVVTPRSSRDICERERARAKQVHHIIRYEYWIECSCRYKGRSFNHACPKCGAENTLNDNSVTANFRFS